MIGGPHSIPTGTPGSSHRENAYLTPFKHKPMTPGNFVVAWIRHLEPLLASMQGCDASKWPVIILILNIKIGIKYAYYLFEIRLIRLKIEALKC